MQAGRVVTLSAAAALLLGGVVEAGSRELSAALFAAGCIVLGAWLTTEILHRKD
jgi:hypothetical protein